MMCENINDWQGRAAGTGSDFKNLHVRIFMGESIDISIHFLIANLCTYSVAVDVFHQLIFEQDLQCISLSR